MKIRQQFLVIEISLNISLFLSLFLTVSSLVDSIRLEDLKIKTAALQDTATRTRYSAVGMLTSTETDSFLVFEYEQLIDLLNEELKEIRDDRLFNQLPGEAHELLDTIQDNWANSISSLPADQISSLLQLRQQNPEGISGSIGYIQGIYEKNP